jgi:hypothetical protein
MIIESLLVMIMYPNIVLIIEIKAIPKNTNILPTELTAENLKGFVRASK